jgi:molecular chaperone GrpE
MAKMNDQPNGAPEPALEPEAAAPSLEEQLAALQAELAETKDRLLRALAEAENVRRRAQRETADAARYGAANFAKDLLDVADNLRRALASMPESEANDERSRNLLAGVAATERALLAAFERHGINRIDPAVGARFDHNFHQAMFEVESPELPPGSIAQVLQPGYVFHDRLLRPALVGVVKAAASPQPGTDDG